MLSWFKSRVARREQVEARNDTGLNTLNRSALILRPKAPYIRWATKVSGEPVHDVRRIVCGDRTAYLIARNDGEELEPALLEARYAELFERELFEWNENRATWPAPRTLAMFKQWFDWELCSLTVDMDDGVIGREFDSP